MRLMTVQAKTLSSGPPSFALMHIERLGGSEDKGSQDVTHIHSSQKLELGYSTKHSLLAEEQ